MAWLRTWAQRRRGNEGFAQVLLSLGVFILLLALFGSWMGYRRVEDTKSTISHVVTQGLATGIVTPVSHGGGYENEAYGGTGVPQENLSGVVNVAAQIAQETIPASQAGPAGTGFTWTLSPTDQRRWDLSGPITVSQVALSSSAPYDVTAQITAPLQISLWGVAVLPAHLHLAITVPIVGQQANQQFQSY